MPTCVHCGGEYHPECHPVAACIAKDADGTDEVWCDKCEGGKADAPCACPCHAMPLRQVMPDCSPIPIEIGRHMTPLNARFAVTR